MQIYDNMEKWGIAIDELENDATRIVQVLNYSIFFSLNKGRYARNFKKEVKQMG